MLKKIVPALVAAAFAVGSTVATVQPAEAGRGARIGLGVAAGVIGLGVLGAYARPYGSCYRVGGGCHWREGSCYINRNGDEVCRRGYKVCEPSRTVCD
jgi:hypothetical protein